MNKTLLLSYHHLPLLLLLLLSLESISSFPLTGRSSLSFLPRPRTSCKQSSTSTGCLQDEPPCRRNSSKRRLLLLHVHQSTASSTEDSAPTTSDDENDSHHYYDYDHSTQPPEYLRDLNVGERFVPFPPLEILKLSDDPPIFLLRNFIPDVDRDILQEAFFQRGGELETAKCNEKETHSKTKPTSDGGDDDAAGALQHRVGSNVCWISPPDDDDTLEIQNQEDAGDSTTTTIQPEQETAGFMTSLSSRLFLEDCFVDAEPLQLVRYKTGGKFDLHHDGLDRTVTVLTYLNGIAGTWFPFVGAPLEDIPQYKLSNKDAVLKGKTPGKDGIWIVGDEKGGSSLPESKHVARIQAGDSLVFYNYERHEDYGKIINWKSLHCALPAPCEKWIATNWLRGFRDVEK